MTNSDERTAQTRRRESVLAAEPAKQIRIGESVYQSLIAEAVIYKRTVRGQAEYLIAMGLQRQMEMETRGGAA
jgi:hypothetical protein